MIQRCIQCDARYPLEQVVFTCDACGSVLEIAVDANSLGDVQMCGRGVWRYASFLPVDASKRVSLSEGDTGFHPCPTLAKMYGIDRMFVKNEGENPTCSFKDRGMTVGVTKAIEMGAKAVACASTGNTAASLAAYGGRAGLNAVVLIPGGNVAMGKIAQSVAHGAQIVQVDGNFDDAMRVVRELSAETGDVYLLNSINPFRLEGQKTLAFEVCEALGDAPDALVLPMGNAGNISAIWKGFREFRDAGLSTKLPRMIGVQAEGAAPIAKFVNDNLDKCYVSEPETIATAIRIGAPVNWAKAVAAIHDSHGLAATVSDAEILAAQRELAHREGVFVEPASVAPIAYLKKHGVDAETVVCVTTGHGLKDPDAILRVEPTILHAQPTLDSLQEALGLR